MKKLLALTFFVLSVTCLMAQKSANVTGYLYYRGQPLAYTTVTCEATGNTNWYPPLKTSTTTTNSSGYFSLPTLTGNNIISIQTPTSQRVNLPFTIWGSTYELKADVGDI